MELDYSYDGLINRDLFYQSLNTINIYVEDRDKEYEYETIFGRLLGESIKIETIFGVGGKNELINAYNVKCKDSSNAKNIFIADLDFDCILNKEMIEDKNFVYLDQYCIENYLIDKFAVKKFMKGRVKKTLEEVENIIKYDDWFNRTTNDLYELFILFMIIQSKDIRMKNVNKSEHRYLKNTKDESWQLDQSKYDEYYSEIKEELPNINQLIQEMDYRVNKELKLDKHTVISGKNYIASLKKYLSKFSKRPIGNDDFKTILLDNFDIKKLDFIKTKIEFILDSN